MRIDVITLFPEMFTPLEHSIVGRARKSGLLNLILHQLRDFAINRYGQVDDEPYGGERGMVLRPEPVKAAMDHCLKLLDGAMPHRVFLTPQGRPFDQKAAAMLAKRTNILIICGHYKGLDERIRQNYVDEEISLGDFVLSGGELPALAIIDAVTRLLPGVLGDAASAETDSFFKDHRLGWPVYTRPEEFDGIKVPSVLLTGHHEKIRQWRLREGLRRTKQRRPELLGRLELTEEEKALLDEDFSENL